MDRFRLGRARAARLRGYLLTAAAVTAVVIPVAVANASALTGVAGSRTVAAGSRTVAAAKPLAGKIIGIDPGHNGRNWTDPAFLSQQVWNGREWEDCDTTGTQTASGYTEARFTFNVARYLVADLRKDGARVVLTRANNRGIGPCVNRRARLLDRAHANVSIDIHADYGPSWGRGFTVLEPIKDGPNDKVIKSSVRFGRDVHLEFLRHTPIRISDYYGHNGYIFRNDLAGLNLTTMPKILIECGNMNNAADARLLTSARMQRRIAWALSLAIVRFLAGR
ncbi:MAG TPA: N-acetylmuramoyl-L-alanine amidase [Streptosporangiaceae bacterium]|nr:N-acetylmuramoyl-L-alanine amidase [Streptosporangiaceae bacterium]